MNVFPSLRIEGGLFSPDLFEALANGSLPGQTPRDFGLEGRRSVTDEAAQTFQEVRAQWRIFKNRLARLPEEDSATTDTRVMWMIPFFNLLGYELRYNPRAYEVGGLSFAISHRAGEGEFAPPVHIVGYRQDLGRLAPSSRPRLSPHALVQEYLNRSEALWGLVTNGRIVRLLRNSTYVRRQAYVEFDIEALIEEERFDDFVLLYRLLHRTRLPRGDGRPDECWLEQYYRFSVEQGGRVREHLREGVEQCLRELGNGFLEHEGSQSLRAWVRENGAAAFYRELLRLVYRFLFLLVSEERGIISRDPIYLEHYGVTRLRRLADNYAAYTDDVDIWLSLRALWHILRDEKMAALLGTSPLNGELFESLALDEALITNRRLLGAFRHLAYYQESASAQARRVNYAALDTEELGSVYESLLDFHPHIQEKALGRLTFDLAPGSERKSTGSYYTPPQLVAELIRSALEPVIAERLSRAKTAAEKEQALLSIKVCDPACGSGHFLLAAARRLGKELARLRTGEDEPAPERVREAVRDVVAHCIYGVDKNPLAVELAQVALWLESHAEGKPLTFLEHRIKCGDSLVGVFDMSVLKEGLPDEAFTALQGEDKATATRLRNQNRQERAGQLPLILEQRQDPTGQLARLGWQLEAIPDDSPEEIRKKHALYARRAQDSNWARLKEACDLWVAAFFQSFAPAAQEGGLGLSGITTGVVRRALAEQSVPKQVLARAEVLAQTLRFFHWSLEFPEVFARGPHPPAPSPKALDGGPHPPAPPPKALDGGPHPPAPSPKALGEGEVGGEGATARGGFDVILGNPPWERIKLQEQEFFASRDAQIALAPNAAARKRLIAQLERKNPALWNEYRGALHIAESTSRFLRGSGQYPLTGRGDINTYSVFAERMRALLNPQGRAGVIVPTGIATDDTNKYFFANLVTKGQLASLFDFENREGIFPDVHRSYKFCLLTLRGGPHPPAPSPKALGEGEKGGEGRLPSPSPRRLGEGETGGEGRLPAPSPRRLGEGEKGGEGRLPSPSPRRLGEGETGGEGRLPSPSPRRLGEGETGGEGRLPAPSPKALGAGETGGEGRLPSPPPRRLGEGEKGGEEMAFAFFCTRAEHLRDPRRVFTLGRGDIERLNPNTLTVPIFRTRQDADLTRAIYNRVPVLVREGPHPPTPSPSRLGEGEQGGEGHPPFPSPNALGEGKTRGEGQSPTLSPNTLGEREIGGEVDAANPWGVRFLRMFDMANDSHLFRTREQLEQAGYVLRGNRFVRPASGGPHPPTPSPSRLGEGKTEGEGHPPAPSPNALGEGEQGGEGHPPIPSPNTLGEGKTGGEGYPPNALREGEQGGEIRVSRRTIRALVEGARLLRRQATTAEAFLWMCLRNRQLLGKKFRRQHPIGPFIADFYCDEARLVIEIDGAVHREPSQRERDQSREQILRHYGVRVIRFTNDEVLSHIDRVLERIAEALLGPRPHPPAPSPNAGDSGPHPLALSPNTGGSGPHPPAPSPNTGGSGPHPPAPSPNALGEGEQGGEGHPPIPSPNTLREGEQGGEGHPPIPSPNTLREGKTGGEGYPPFPSPNTLGEEEQGGEGLPPNTLGEGEPGGEDLFLPLYEAKMIWHYDHRYGTYEGVTDRSSTQLPRPSEAQHADPTFVAQPWYWVPATEVAQRLQGWKRRWLVGFRKVARATDERTAIFSLMPRVGVSDGAPLVFFGRQRSALDAAACLANFDSLVFDFVTRQKIGGVSLSMFILRQLPVLPPSAYGPQDLAFILPRVLELAYTAWDLKPFADDLWREAAAMPLGDGTTLQHRLHQQWLENRGSRPPAPSPSRLGERETGGKGPLLSPSPKALGEGEQGGEGYPPNALGEGVPGGEGLPPFLWDEARRAVLRAELDAYYARLYGLTRKQLRYILDPADLTEKELADILDPWEEVEDPLDPQGYAARSAKSDFPSETFRALKEKEMREYGEYRTRRLILEAWERLVKGEASGDGRKPHPAVGA